MSFRAKAIEPQAEHQRQSVQRIADLLDEAAREARTTLGDLDDAAIELFQYKLRHLNAVLNEKS